MLFVEVSCALLIVTWVQRKETSHLWVRLCLIDMSGNPRYILNIDHLVSIQYIIVHNISYNAMVAI